MSLADGLFAAIDGFSRGLNDLLGQSAGSFCFLETADDKHTLVGKDGSLVSLLDLRGALSMKDGEGFERMIEMLRVQLATEFEQAGHILQFVINYDPQRAKEDVEQIFQSHQATSERLNLSLGDVLNDWKHALGSFSASEQVWIACWTGPYVLPKSEQKRNRKERARRTRNGPLGRSGQRVDFALDGLRDRHAAFVSGLIATLKKSGLLVEHCSSHRFLYEIRKLFDPDFTGTEWRPSLPGDPLPQRMPDTGYDDISYILYPDIRSQVLPRDAYCPDVRTVKIGSVYHAPMMMSMPPQEVQPFNQLFTRLVADRIPYRMSFLVQGGGLSSLRYKDLLASIFHFASTHNQRFNRAMDNLRERELESETIVKLQCMFGTHARDAKTLDKRVNQLVSAVQGWGSCDVSMVSGDPLLGLSALAPGYMPSSPAPAAAAPLDQTLRMLPLTRPVSIWDKGSVPLRSIDGKLMPYEQGSSHQAAWIDVGVAPMGGGKSVLLNVLNFGFCLSAGAQQLPRVSIIDIGHSSSGLISLLEGALPPSQQHQVAYHRLRMTDDYAMNPFDTPLGCIHPLPAHRAFLTNLLSLFATSLDDDAPQEGIPGLAQACIDHAYTQLSPDRNPRPYSESVDRDVHRVVEEVGLEIDDATSWWDIVKGLFDAGRVHEANLAQRYAVPLLSDVAAQARRDTVTGTYQQETVGREPITNFFWRKLVEAIELYPILKQPTRFHIGDARVVSLDLNEVAPKGGAAADRQTAVMYMLARHVSASHFFLMPEDLQQIPKRFRDYHGERIEEIRQDPKRICFDEFHRVSRNTNVSMQLVGDIETAVRESRKWNLHIGLYSQDLSDYPDIILELATCVFILGAGTQKGVQKMAERFSLNKVSQHGVLHHTGNPDSRGANLLALFKTAEGRMEQLVTNTLGPVALWAFSSTAEDVAVRKRLYEVMEPHQARELLARKYPSGVKRKVERIKQNMGRQGAIDSAGAIEQILQELTGSDANPMDVSPRKVRANTG